MEGNKVATMDLSKAVIDREHRCIDRSTELGQQFQQMNDYIETLPDPNERAYLREFMAYTEAAVVIGKLYPGDDGKKKLDQLVQRVFAKK